MAPNLVELLDHRPADTTAYLLIDNSAYDGVWLAQQTEDLKIRSRFGPLVNQLQRSRMPSATLWGRLDDPEESAAAPLLIQWTSEKRGRGLLDHLQSQPSGKCALSVLFSTEPLGTLAERLRLRTQVSVMGEDYLLRIFDTRILFELLPQLTPQQREAFTALAGAWHYCDRDDQWVSLRCTAGPHDQYLPLEFDDAQQDAVFRIGSADRIEAAIDRFLEDNPLEKMTPGERYQWIAERQYDASTYRIVEHSGQLHFCLHALHAGNDSHRAPEWASTLKQLASPKISA